MTHIHWVTRQNILEIPIDIIKFIKSIDIIMHDDFITVE